MQTANYLDKMILVQVHRNSRTQQISYQKRTILSHTKSSLLRVSRLDLKLGRLSGLIQSLLLPELDRRGRLISKFGADS
jgi:hypothetical protein